MVTQISTHSIIDTNNRVYTCFNIVTTIALFALREMTPLPFNAFGLSAITTLVINYCIFKAIAISSLSDKQKFVLLQISLITFIMLGSALTHMVLTFHVFSLSKIIYVLLRPICIANLPLYMLLLSLVFSPVKTLSAAPILLKKNITIHNRLLRELCLVNGASYQRPSAPITSKECSRFIVLLLLEALTRGARDGIDSGQNTVVFEFSPTLAPFLITPINESSQPILNPSQFLTVYSHLQDFPQEWEFQEEREILFKILLYEFQKLSPNLQKKYYNHILQYHDLQHIVPSDLKVLIQEYQKVNTPFVADVDAILAMGTSFNKEISQFASKEPSLRTLAELKDIMSRYTSLQNSLRESLSYEPVNSITQTRIRDLIQSLYLSYQENIVPIRFQFPDDTPNEDMEQPAWNYLATKFPRDFFAELPLHLFSNPEDPDQLEEDFTSYNLNTAEDLINKIFNGDIAFFRASSQKQVLEKLINYCTINSPSNRYKKQFLKVWYQAHKIIKISTEIFSTIIVPLLVHPHAFVTGALYAIITKIHFPSAFSTTISTSLFKGYFLSMLSLGSFYAGASFTSRYVVPLLE